jgi:hypothetical protein
MTQNWEEHNGFMSLKVQGVPGRYVLLNEPWNPDAVYNLTEYTADIIAKTLGLGSDIFKEVLPDYLQGGEWQDD